MGSFFFAVFPIMFGLVFCLVVGVFVYVFVKTVSEKRKNKASPLLTVPAEVVTKRQHHNHSGTNGHSWSSYYVTFQFASGDRLELSVPSSEVGYLVEGDRGNLSFKGTQFVSFERQ